MKEYDEAVLRNPGEAKYYCNRAICFMKLMGFNSAVKDLETCLSLDPNYVKAYAKKGVCHQVCKELHKA